VKSLLVALFPSDCRFCQTSLFTVSRLPVCSSCIESIQPILLPAALFAETCWAGLTPRWRRVLPECASEGPAYERAVNFGAYTGALRRLIHLLKYERVRTAAHLLGQYATQACLQLEGDIDVAELLMIPVPAHKLRMRSRGFNQAELIARAAQRGIEEAIGAS